MTPSHSNVHRAPYVASRVLPLLTALCWPGGRGQFRVQRGGGDGHSRGRPLDGPRHADDALPARAAAAGRRARTDHRRDLPRRAEDAAAGGLSGATRAQVRWTALGAGRGEEAAVIDGSDRQLFWVGGGAPEDGGLDRFLLAMLI